MDEKVKEVNESNKAPQDSNVSRKNKTRSVVLIIITSILILGLIGAGIWYYTSKNNNNTNQNNNENDNENENDDKASEDQTLSFEKNELYISNGDIADQTISGYLKYENINEDDITFTNSNDKVITLDEDGGVTAVGVGQSIITAKYKNLTAKITINVGNEIYADSISINDKAYYVYAGETLDIKYEYYPENANMMDLKWVSSDPSVATIKDGKVVGVKVGKTTITLTNNKSNCSEDEYEGCSTKSTTDAYVVNHKITYEVKENSKYTTIKELADRTEINYGGSYTKTYDLRIKIVGNAAINYSKDDIDVDIKNLNGSKTTLEYVGVDSSCENCYLYKLTYTFDDTKSDLDNYSKINFTLPDGSMSVLEVYSYEAYGCYNACKPVLYLYPKTSTPINVSLAHPEYITTSYPKYVNNWNVFASPNGNLNINGRNYYALYWDERYYVSKDESIDFKTGFYVNKENASKFLEEKLNIIGLNEREANEFIMYWLPILENNEHSLVYFELTEERELNNKLFINPKPDSLLRVIIHVKKVNNIVKITPQKLTTFQRNGFVAVEWGGVQQKES